MEKAMAAIADFNKAIQFLPKMGFVLLFLRAKAVNSKTALKSGGINWRSKTMDLNYPVWSSPFINELKELEKLSSGIVLLLKYKMKDYFQKLAVTSIVAMVMLLNLSKFGFLSEKMWVSFRAFLSVWNGLVLVALPLLLSHSITFSFRGPFPFSQQTWKIFTIFDSYRSRCWPFYQLSNSKWFLWKCTTPLLLL